MGSVMVKVHQSRMTFLIMLNLLNVFGRASMGQSTLWVIYVHTRDDIM